MIITFCGHSDFNIGKEELCDAVLSTIEKYGAEKDVTFYLGGYGDFDAIALQACKRYKASHPSAKLIFVTPYLNESYLKNNQYRFGEYDEILFPEIENCLPRYAILDRNEWMVKRADLVIAFVNYGWGGAAKTLKKAVKLCKNFVNLGTKVF